MKGVVRLIQSKIPDTRTLKDLEDFILSRFLGEDALKRRSPDKLCSPIFNAAVRSIERPDRDQRTPSFEGTNQLLTSYMGNGESRVKFTKR